MSKELTTQTHDDLIKKLAWEVARNVIDHHLRVYPKIFEGAPSTFPISFRNGIYNEISYAMKCHSDAEIIQWIAKSEAHRKEMRRLKRLGDKAEQWRKANDHTI